MSARNMAHVCACGNPACLVPLIGEAMARYEAAGGDPAQTRILWCTSPGCRSFEIVDDLTHRLSYQSARCPDHDEAGGS